MEGTYTSYGPGDPITHPWAMSTNPAGSPYEEESPSIGADTLEDMFLRDGKKIDELIDAIFIHSEQQAHAAAVKMLQTKDASDFIALIEERAKLEAKQQVEDEEEAQEAEFKKWLEDMLADRQAA